MKKYIIVLFILLCFGTAAAGQQTSGVTAQTIINDARKLLNETTPDFWVDTSMLSYLNMGIKDASAKTGCLDTAYTMSLLNGVTEYSVSSGVSFYKVKTVVYQSGATTWQGLRMGNPQSIGNITSAKQPVFWYPNGNNVVIYPPPETSGNTLYAMLSQRVTSIDISSTIPTPAIYDQALVYYVVSMALFQDSRPVAAKSFFDLYMEDIKYYSQIEALPFEPVKEIIK